MANEKGAGLGWRSTAGGRGCGLEGVWLQERAGIDVGGVAMGRGVANNRGRSLRRALLQRGRGLMEGAWLQRDSEWWRGGAKGRRGI